MLSFQDVENRTVAGAPGCAATARRGPHCRSAFRIRWHSAEIALPGPCRTGETNSGEELPRGWRPFLDPVDPVRSGADLLDFQTCLPQDQSQSFSWSWVTTVQQCNSNLRPQDAARNRVNAPAEFQEQIKKLQAEIEDEVGSWPYLGRWVWPKMIGRRNWMIGWLNEENDGNEQVNSNSVHWYGNLKILKGV